MYGLYLRVSTQEQAQSREGSIRSQLQRLQEHLGIKDPGSRYLVYEERGRSGKNTDRPEFQRMLDDMQKGVISAVLCTELSRVSRSVIDFHQFLEFCERHKVGLICLREQFDTTTAHGRLILGILSVFAQFEREQISERTSINMQARARRGLYNGGYLYGYHPRPGQKGYLDIDAEEAEVVRLMLDKYLELGSFCQVTNWLNARGYRTREYTTTKGKFRPGKPWSSSSVAQILQNPVISVSVGPEGKW